MNGQVVVADPFLIFINKNCSYPISGVPTNMEGVSYRSASNGFMTRKVFFEWLGEPKAFQSDVYGRRKVVFCDNVASHNESEEITARLEEMNVEIRRLPANSTHLTQPCDSFVIEKIKKAWVRQWEKKKMQLVQKNDWRPGSGALRNPGKTYFLDLARKSVREVNNARNINGLTYPKLAMIRCGLSRDVNGVWHVGQLSEPLRKIVENHRDIFDRAAAH
ncbi:hypothetical protein GEMRC1_000123 [Eukaryota sp. GEM-RC1]